MTRLLLVSCSSTKSNIPSAIPAIDRYEGGIYRVLKKARREGYWSETIDLFIVSAKHGLIAEDVLLEPYDQKMTKKRALELQEEISHALDTLWEKREYDKAFLNLGEIYIQTIACSQAIGWARQAGILQEARGKIGMKQKQTKAWIMSLQEER